jgi:ribosomal-protein-alanine N-acetyltransferase
VGAQKGICQSNIRRSNPFEGRLFLLIRLNNLFSTSNNALQTALRKIGDCVIRHCDHPDLPSVVEINIVSLPEHYSDYFFESILKELPESFIVAETNQKIVGYIMCKIEFGFSNFRKLGFVKKGHVVSVAVLQEHRGKGIGWSLMVEAINGLTARRADEIYLEVRVSNDLAIRMYQRLGFLIKSRLHSYYRDGEDAYLMALEFPQ